MSTWHRDHPGPGPPVRSPAGPPSRVRTRVLSSASSLPFGSSGSAACLQQLTGRTSARFRARAPGPVSGQLYETAGGETGHAARFPAAFRPPAFASRASFPARGFRPPHGRPATPPAAARTRAGFPCSARVRPGWLRMPSLPRGRRCPQRPVISRPPACRIATASPCHPGLRPAPGRICDEASARVHCHSPHTSLPLACEPGRNGFPGLFPGLRTPPGRTRQRTPGRGQARTLPGLRPWHQPASLRRTHSQRATSRRTNSLICAAQLVIAEAALAAPNGGSVRLAATPRSFTFRDRVGRLRAVPRGRSVPRLVIVSSRSAGDGAPRL